MTDETKPTESEDWFCSTECEKEKAATPKKEKSQVCDEDSKQAYTKALLWRGLGHMARRDCIRENDGPAIVAFWRIDLPDFRARNHNKYVILSHRLTADLNGWMPPKVQADLIWNRTVNLQGGLGRNIEMDLANEFLNCDFKTSLGEVSGQLTRDTIDRHGQMAGSFGRSIDRAFHGNVAENEPYVEHTKKTDRHADLERFVSLLLPEDLFSDIPGRSHKAYTGFSYTEGTKNGKKLQEKIQQLSKRMDRRRRMVRRRQIPN